MCANVLFLLPLLFYVFILSDDFLFYKVYYLARLNDSLMLAGTSFFKNGMFRFVAPDVNFVGYVSLWERFQATEIFTAGFWTVIFICLLYFLRRKSLVLMVLTFSICVVALLPGQKDILSYNVPTLSRADDALNVQSYAAYEFLQAYWQREPLAALAFAQGRWQGREMVWSVADKVFEGQGKSDLYNSLSIITMPQLLEYPDIVRRSLYYRARMWAFLTEDSSSLTNNSFLRAVDKGLTGMAFLKAAHYEDERFVDMMKQARGYCQKAFLKAPNGNIFMLKQLVAP